MTLSGAMDRLVTHADACTGVKYASTIPPETPGVLPAVFVWLERGNVGAESNNQMRAFHTLAVDYITPRTMIGTAQDNAVAYVEQFPNKLAIDPTLNGTVSTVQMGEGEIPYEAISAVWGSVEVRILRFHVTVKIRGNAQ